MVGKDARITQALSHINKRQTRAKFKVKDIGK